MVICFLLGSVVLYCVFTKMEAEKREEIFLYCSLNSIVAFIMLSTCGFELEDGF